MKRRSELGHVKSRKCSLGAPFENEIILTYHLKLDDLFGGDLRQILRNRKDRIQTEQQGLRAKCFPTPQKVQRELTTVLIFFLPSEALIKHLLSAGSNDSEWPFLGTGLVLPSSGRDVSHLEMQNKKTWHRCCLLVGHDTTYISLM